MDATTRSLRPERRGGSRRSVIDEAKRLVPCIDLADRLVADNGGRWRTVGDRWTTQCVLGDHEERTPSFVVYPGDRGWWCFGCQRGGSVVDLAMHAWGIDRPDVAAAEVLLLFGHEIPLRPATWYRKQRRQQPVRDALEQIKIDILRRRLFRIVWPALQAIPDEAERDAEAEVIWEELEQVAAEHLARREDERR
jgi:DNA primase